MDLAYRGNRSNPSNNLPWIFTTVWPSATNSESKVIVSHYLLFTYQSRVEFISKCISARRPALGEESIEATASMHLKRSASTLRDIYRTRQGIYVTRSAPTLLDIYRARQGIYRLAWNSRMSVQQWFPPTTAL